nr:MAG TPA: hypothetical protein [Caudoviricetes sp.]
MAFNLSSPLLFTISIPDVYSDRTSSKLLSECFNLVVDCFLLHI